MNAPCPIARASGRWLLAGVLLLGAAGCRVQTVNQELYACEKDSDCGEGWVCLLKACRPKAVADALDACGGVCGVNGGICCASGCVDPWTSDQHCGACGNVCLDGERCLRGECRRETSHGGSCANELDDDGDGLTDCSDVSDCAPGARCRSGSCCKGECRNEGSGDLCGNGQDDDCDGKIDCDDEDCQGRTCGAGLICRNRVCAQACFIDGVHRSADEPLEGNACLRCVPGTSTTSWTAAARGIACGTGRACDGQGACRRAAGQPCGGVGDCASFTCSDGLCAP